MAYVKTGQLLIHGTEEVMYGSAGVAAPMNLTAAAQKIALMGSFWTPDHSAKSIRNIGMSFGVGTKSGGSGLTVSLQDLTLATSGPLPDETQDQTVAISNAALSTSAQWITTGNLSSDRAVNPGDLLAVVVEFDGGGWITPDVVRAGMGWQLNTSIRRRTLPATASKTGGAWTIQAVSPCVVFTCSDGSFATFAGSPVFSLGFNTHVFRQDTAGADEYAHRFRVPFNCYIDGCQIRVITSSTTSDFDVVLYDASDVELVRKSIDAAHLTQTGDRITNIAFPSQIAITKNTTYRLAIQPTQSTSSVTIYSMDVQTAGHMILNPGGVECYTSTRLNSGAWTDITTNRLMGFGVSISSLEDGAGGGGLILPRPMNGGYSA